MGVPGIYQSRFSGPEIDQAIMNALGFTPGENGWIKVVSAVDNPISLNELLTVGNYRVDFFIDGPEEIKNISPINVCVYESTDYTLQYIRILDTVYYRQTENGIYPSGWFTKKTTNYIFIDNIPAEPAPSTLAIIKNEEGSYTLNVYMGKWIEVAPPHVMLGSVYDPQGRETDFFKYVDDFYNQITSCTLGVTWDVLDRSELFVNEMISSYRIFKNEFICTFKYSSKIVYCDGKNYYLKDLPISMAYPELIAFEDDTGEKIGKVYVYDIDTPISNCIYAFSDLHNGTWEYINMTLNYIRSDIDDSDIKPMDMSFHGIQSNCVYSALNSLDPYIIVRYSLSSAITKTGKLHLNRDDGPYKIGISGDLKTSYAGNDLSAYLNSINISPYRDGIYSSNTFAQEFNMNDSYTYAYKISDNMSINSVNTNAINFYSISTSYKRIYDSNGTMILKPFLDFYIKDITGTLQYIELSEYDIFTDSHYYKAYSNFIEIFDMYTGYVCDTMNKIHSIIFTADPTGEAIPVLSTNFIYQIPDDDFIIDFLTYEPTTLRIVGHKMNGMKMEYSIMISSQDANILDAIQDHILDQSIHFTDQDREVLNSRETKTHVKIRLNNLDKDLKELVVKEIAGATESSNSIKSDLLELQKKLDEHFNDKIKHITQEQIDSWDAKADPEHRHVLDGRVKIHARDIVTGTININRLPLGARERIFKVETIEDMYNLTINDVQDGDRIAIKSTSVANAYELYEVVRQDLLAHNDPETGEFIVAEEEAFHECAAGSGVWIDWSNVDHKPTTVAGYGIEDTYTKEEADATMDEKIADATALLEARYATYDLDELYRIIHHTDEEITIIEQEMTDAVDISEKVNRHDLDLKELWRRVSQMAEDFDETQEIVNDLLNKFS